VNFLKVISLIFSTSLLLFSKPSDTNYHWPIDASKHLAATFCEPRSGHLHEGIDIKTWGQMGVPCFAIGDGYVEKVVTRYRGYGKLLVLRLDNGERAIYAHLESFVHKIDLQILAEQKASKNYQVQVRYEPNEYRVSKGEIIAYSGTSGTSHPHLHFEIHDTLGIPQNPLSYFNIKDSKDPIITHVILEPLEKMTLINGHPLSETLYFYRNPDPKKPLASIDGTFGFQIVAFDYSDGTWNKYAIYETQVFVDDSLAYHIVFNDAPGRTSQYHNDIYAQKELDYRWSPTKLYVPNSGDEHFLTSDEFTGHLNLKRGIHRFKIVILDYKGNLKTAEFSLENKEHALWTINKVQDKLQFSTQNNKYPLFENWYDTINQIYFTPEKTIIPLDFLFENGNDPSAMDIPALETTWGSHQVFQISRLENSNQISYKLDYNSGNILLNFDAAQAQQFPPYLQLQYNDTTSIVTLFQSGENTALTERISPRDFYTANSIQMPFKDTTLIYELHPFESISPFDAKHIEFVNSHLSVDISNPRNQIMNYIITEEDSLEGLSFIRIQSAPWQSVKLGFKINSTENEAIYSKSGSSWTLLNRTMYTGLDVEAGQYTSFKDVTMPEIELISNSNDYHTNGRVTFKISDDGSPLRNPSKQIEASVNGNVVYFEYNFERKEASWQIPKQFTSHSFRVKLKVWDEVGNLTRNTSIIYLK
jgi:hypothetical protein